jgi:hypothetical protein
MIWLPNRPCLYCPSSPTCPTRPVGIPRNHYLTLFEEAIFPAAFFFPTSFFEVRRLAEALPPKAFFFFAVAFPAFAERRFAVLFFDVLEERLTVDFPPLLTFLTGEVPISPGSSSEVLKRSTPVHPLALGRYIRPSEHALRV